MVKNVPKRIFFVKLLFLGSTSFQIWKKLQILFSDKLTFCNLKTVFTSLVRVNSFFTFKDKFLCCNYCPSFEDFSILTMESNDFKLNIMESLLIAHDKPVLNKADSSLPLDPI